MLAGSGGISFNASNILVNLNCGMYSNSNINLSKSNENSTAGKVKLGVITRAGDEICRWRWAI